MPRNILVIILLILALFALGVTTFYLALKEKSERMGKEERVATLPEVEKEPLSQPQEPITELIDTSDWKTYWNEELGVSFKYPNEWELEKCIRFIKGSVVNARYIPDCNIWIDFLRGYFFYKFGPDISFEEYFSSKDFSTYSPYFYVGSSFINYKKTKISTGQEGIIQDGYICYHEPCPPVGLCGDVPPLVYCEYRRIFISYLNDEKYPLFVVGKEWGRECLDEEIVKELHFNKGLRGLHPYLEKEYKSCKEENKTELQIFDKFINEIQVW